MPGDDVTHVTKACAYITRGTELLTFEGPGHDRLQVPKGTVEPGETPREAVHREVVEETGLATFGRFRPVATDVWRRRDSKRYVRNFYHAEVVDAPDAWTHTVTGTGEERGAEFELSWVELPADEPFALDLDDYLDALPVGNAGRRTGVAAD